MSVSGIWVVLRSLRAAVYELIKGSKLAVFTPHKFIAYPRRRKWIVKQPQMLPLAIVPRAGSPPLVLVGPIDPNKSRSIVLAAALVSTLFYASCRAEILRSAIKRVMILVVDSLPLFSGYPAKLKDMTVQG